MMMSNDYGCSGDDFTDTITKSSAAGSVQGLLLSNLIFITIVLGKPTPPPKTKTKQNKNDKMQNLRHSRDWPKLKLTMAGWE